MWTFKMYSRNTKTINEPTASNNKSDRPQVNIWDTWKTLKYLNINENRKDVDWYKFIVLFLLIVVLFGFLNIKSVKLYAIPFTFSITLLVYKLDTLLLKQKKFPVLDITGFFFYIRTLVTALVLRTSAFTCVFMLNKKPAISNTGLQKKTIKI
jgi:uncharacterized integral membrane protein